MSLKFQYIWLNFMVLSVFIDQIKNWILQAYHSQMDLQVAFQFWWLSFYFENMSKYLKFIDLLIWMTFLLELETKRKNKSFTISEKAPTRFPGRNVKNTF